MNFNCIIKTGLVAVAAMVSLSSFSQDLIARQAPIDKKLKSVDSLALQKQIRAEQSEYPALSLYPNWNNQYAHSYGNAIIPETYTIDLTGFRMPTPSTKITSPFGPRWRRMHNGLDLKVNIGDTIVSAFDGMKYAITSGKTQAQLEAELSKEVGETSDYLATNRAYRTEKDVFDDFTQEERNQMFGVAPATVWENIKGYQNNPELVETLAQGNAFAKDLMDSFIASILKRWKLVLANRLIPNNLDTVRSMVAIHTDSRNSVDDKRFAEVNDLRFYLAKDSDDRKSLFTRLIDALNDGEYDLASKLQIEMNDKMEELEAKYANYAKNIF